MKRSPKSRPRILFGFVAVLSIYGWVQGVILAVGGNISDAVWWWVGALLLTAEIVRRRRALHDAALGRGLTDLSRDDISPEITQLVAAGKKFDALKRYRESTGASLKEAKSVIDGLAAGTHGQKLDRGPL